MGIGTAIAAAVVVAVFVKLVANKKDSRRHKGRANTFYSDGGMPPLLWGDDNPQTPGDNQSGCSDEGGFWGGLFGGGDSGGGSDCGGDSGGGSGGDCGGGDGGGGGGD